MGNEDGDDKCHSKISKEESPPSIESAWGIEDISPVIQDIPNDANLLVPESFVFDEPTAPPLDDEPVVHSSEDEQQESIQTFHKLFSMLSEVAPNSPDSMQSIDEDLSELFTKKLEFTESIPIDPDSSINDSNSESNSITASVPVIQETELFSPSLPELETESILSDQSFQDAPQTVSSESEHNDFHDSLQDIEQEKEKPLSCTNCGKDLENIQNASFCPYCGQKISKKVSDLFVFSGNNNQVEISQHSETQDLITTTTKRDHERALILGPNYQRSLDEISSMLSSHSSKKQRQSISPTLSLSLSIMPQLKDVSPARVYAAYTFSGPISTNDGYVPSIISCFPKSQTRVARNPIDGKYNYSLVYTPGTINIQSGGLGNNFISEFVPSSIKHHDREYEKWILDPIPNISDTNIFVQCIESWLNEKHHFHLKLYWSWLIDHLQDRSYKTISLLYDNQIKSNHTNLFSQLNQLLFEQNPKEFIKFCNSRRLPHYLLLYSSSNITVMPEYKETLITSFFKYLDDSSDNLQDNDAKSLLAFRMLLILQYTNDAISHLVNSDTLMIKRQWKSILLHAFQVREPKTDPYLYRDLGEKVFHRIPELGMISQLCYIMGIFSSNNVNITMPAHLFVTSHILDTGMHWRRCWWLVYMTNRFTQWINNQSKAICNFDSLMCPSIITANSWYWEWNGEHSYLTHCLEHYKNEANRTRLYNQIFHILGSRKQQQQVTTPISHRVIQDTFHTPIPYIEPDNKIDEKVDDEEHVEDYGLSNRKPNQVKIEEIEHHISSNEHRGSILASMASFFKRKPIVVDSSSTSSLNSNGKIATRANLGEESKFKYDPVLKKWVSGNENEEKKTITKPPPKIETSWSEISSIEPSDESGSVQNVTLSNIETTERIIASEQVNISQSPLSLNPPMMISSKNTIGTTIVPKRQKYTDPFNLTGIGSNA